MIIRMIGVSSLSFKRIKQHSTMVKSSSLRMRNNPITSSSHPVKTSKNELSFLSLLVEDTKRKGERKRGCNAMSYMKNRAIIIIFIRIKCSISVNCNVTLCVSVLTLRELTQDLLALDRVERHLQNALRFTIWRVPWKYSVDLTSRLFAHSQVSSRDWLFAYGIFLQDLLARASPCLQTP